MVSVVAAAAVAAATDVKMLVTGAVTLASGRRCTADAAEHSDN